MTTATLHRPAVAALAELARAEVEEGRLPSCQWALARHGEVVAADAPGAHDGDRFVVFSVTKALTAAAAWQFPELTPDLHVADLIEEFRRGKGAVTVGHLLTHTAGFPRAPMRPQQGAERGQRRARFASWRLDWPPGTRTEYHATSAHWVLADLMETLAGADFREVVRHRVIEPLHLDATSLGPDTRPVVPLVPVGDEPDAAPVQPPDFANPTAFNQPEVRAAGTPGGGAVSTATDIALLYQALLHDPVQLWEPARLALGTATVLNALTDPWTGVPANRTFGLALAGDDGFANLRAFGSATGPRAFGAPGIGGQISWADPDSGLSFCFLTGGIDRNPVAAFLRADRIATAAARCAAGDH